jgi:SAM-dependent methyltransferase
MTNPLFSHSSEQMVVAPNYADWTFSLLAPYVTGQVLEVGCGVGIFTERIASRCRFERLLSIDVSPEAVAYCRGHFSEPRLTIERADAREIEGAFDTIVCMNVLEHIREDDAVLKRFVRLLNLTGRLFLLVPAHQWLYTSWDQFTGHYRRYSKRRMRALIDRAADGESLQLSQFYFNMMGALGYWFVYGMLGKAPQTSVTGQISSFDKWIVPIQRRIEPRTVPFGLSLVSVIQKK